MTGSDGQAPRMGGANGPDTVPARLAELAELLAGESPRSRRFLGGLVIGALAGAALAGLAAARGRKSGGVDRG